MSILFYHTPFNADPNGNEIRTKVIKRVTTEVFEEGKSQNRLPTVIRNYSFTVPAKPRITFAGIVENIDADQLLIKIGVSMVSPNNPREQFSRKKGRSIASHRAKTEPIAAVRCKLGEEYPIFHEACRQLEPRIRETEETWFQRPMLLTINMDEVLNEQSPD